MIPFSVTGLQIVLGRRSRKPDLKRDILNPKFVGLGSCQEYPGWRLWSLLVSRLLKSTQKPGQPTLDSRSASSSALRSALEATVSGAAVARNTANPRPQPPEGLGP